MSGDVIDSQLRARVRSHEADRIIREGGARLWPLPTHDQLALVPTMQAIREEVDIASRMMALRMVERTGWLPSIVRFTAAAREHLAQARPILVSRDLAQSLPDWPSRASLARALLDLRLPFSTTLIVLERPADWLPIETRIQTLDGDAIDCRWAACLLTRHGTGPLLAMPFATLHADRPGELSCPSAVRVSAGPPRPTPAIVGVQLGPEGQITAGWDRTPDRPQDAEQILQVALAIIDRAAAVIEVCNSANIIIAPRTIHGKAAKLAERKERLVPYVVHIRKGVFRKGAGHGEMAAYSHQFDVRGHFAYYRRGAIFDAHADRRRYIPELECEAVPVWRPPHIKGPADKPYRPKVWLLDKQRDGTGD